MKVNIIYSDVDGGVKAASESLSRVFKNNNIKQSLFNMQSVDGGLIKRFIWSIYMYRKKKKDVFILQHFDAILLGVFLKGLAYKNIINVVHTDLYEYYKNSSFFKKIIIRMIFYFLKNKFVIFVSKESESKAKVKFNLKNTVTIYNVYSCPADKPVINQLDDKIKLGSISRLNKTKNIDLLIRVFKEVKCTIPNAELLIYGSGDEQKKLEQYIKQQGCADFVKLLGPSNDKDKMYASIDAMVSFSSIEGFGITILESIGYGKPVFYTDCSSGPRELMSPTTDPLAKTASYEKTNIGYLVKPTQNTATYSQELDDYEAEYVDIMLAFIDDLKNTRFSMEYDPDRFSDKTIVKQWQELIESLNLS